MCGILATLNSHEIPHVLLTRGRDATSTTERFGVHLSHCLHATVGDVPQPLEGTGVFAANCEIYNWRELAKQHGIDARNDAHLLFTLLESLDDDAFADGAITPQLHEVLDSLSGSYAFVYARERFMIGIRDPWGIRPLCYSSDGLASVPEALENAVELHPRRMIRYDLNTGARSFAQIPLAFPHNPRSFDEALTAAVIERLPETDEAYVLLSGGVDSTLVAAIASQHRRVIGVSVAVEDLSSPDRTAAQEVAAALNIELLEVDVPQADVPEAALDIARAIDEPHALKVSSALAAYFGARAIRDQTKVLLSGFGADEVLVSYARGKVNHDPLAESWAALLQLWDTNCLKEDAASMRHTVEARYPYLDREVVAAGWKTLEKPSERDEPKTAVREALRSRNLPADRPKKAAQYGSRLDHVLEKHVKAEGISKSDFLAQAASGKRIGALVSGGKDSLYALWLLTRFGFEPKCMISIASENPDSYMYHTPTTSLLPLIAERIGLPLILERTEGEKEHELDALRRSLARAIEEHAIVGISSGAVKSNYQRDRLLLLCEEFGLSLHSPLWQLDEATYARQITENGFAVIITRVAADGLTKDDVGRPFTLEWAEHLRDLSISMIGEGGEFETLVVSCPLYDKPLLVRLERVEQDGQDVIGVFSTLHK